MMPVMTNRRDLTRLLHEAESGDAGAHEALLQAVYEELQAAARAQLSAVPKDATLQATALVHEAYVKLFRDEQAAWENRRHFFFAASRAMHDVIVEYARRHLARKRGGDRQRVPLEAVDPAADQAAQEILDTDEALHRLHAHDEQCATIVRLRFFGGLTHEQVADTLGLSVARVRREWAYARAWIKQSIDASEKSADS